MPRKQHAMIVSGVSGFAVHNRFRSRIEAQDGGFTCGDPADGHPEVRTQEIKRAHLAMSPSGTTCGHQESNNLVTI